MTRAFLLRTAPVPSAAFMNWVLLGSLIALCVVLLIVESLGLRTTLALNFKGDVKRETRWLAQYGQLVSALVAMAIVYQMEMALTRKHPEDAHPPGKAALSILISSFGAAIAGRILKQLVGRVRPGREDAGKFLGPTWKHANFRESFPSNHTASAVAMSAVLAQLYPSAAPTFWALAVACALLRYVLDAHFPSDVVGGIILGYVGAIVTLQSLHLV
jgi:membrane-associated phospholipid phosphatase